MDLPQPFQRFARSHVALGSVIIRVISSARKGSRDVNADRTAIDLYWLPLGAGGRSVRLNGRLFEAVAAALGRRRVYDLYHSALEARVPEGRFVIEMAPIPVDDAPGRGVVAEGAVGAGVARRLRLFRSEVRCCASNASSLGECSRPVRKTATGCGVSCSRSRTERLA